MAFGFGPMAKFFRLNRDRRPAGPHSGQSPPPGVIGQTFDWTYAERCALYDRWESTYANSIYSRLREGGHREHVLRVELDKHRTWDQQNLPLHGWYNPIASVVDCYQNCIGGTFGVDFDVAEEVGLRADRKKVRRQIIDPIWRIWQASKMGNAKTRLQYFGANYGCVGLFVDARAKDDEGREIPAKRRVPRVLPVHPNEIADADLDDQRNARAVLLRSWVDESPIGSNSPDFAMYEQEIDATGTTTRREGTEIGRVENPLGLCPFVLLHHQDTGHPWGAPAHYGTIPILHQVNWLYSRMGISVDRHVFPKWFAAASGSAPSMINMEDTALAYIQTNPGDTSPKLEALVAKLDYNGILNVLAKLAAHIRDRQPELVLASLEALSGQSGETISKLLTNTDQRVRLARARYEDAVVRATQIALSWGVLWGSWDLGTGTGTAESADRAYHEGYEDFAFTDRPAFPPTAFDRTKMAEADNADDRLKHQIAKNRGTFAGDDEAMRYVGMGEADIERANESKAENAVPPGGGPGFGGNAGGGL